MTIRNIILIFGMIVYVGFISALANNVCKKVSKDLITEFSGALVIIVLIYFLFAGLIKLSSLYEQELENIDDEI